MTSPDLIRELQESRPTAPDSLRARVRELSAPAGESSSRRRFRLALRRPAFVVVPVAAALALAVAAAGVVGLTGSGGHPVAAGKPPALGAPSRSLHGERATDKSA